MTNTEAPTMNITDQGGSYLLTIDHLGRERIVATVPTGSRAAYPEAIARGLAEANVKVDAHIASYRTMYPDLVVADCRVPAEVAHAENTYSVDDHAYLTIPGVLLDTVDGIEYGIDTDQHLAQAGEVALIDSSGEVAEVITQRELLCSPRWVAVRRDDAARVSLATAAELARRSGQ